MLKKIFLISLFFTLTSFSQHIVSVKMNPAKNYTWAILYKLDGVHQKYIANTVFKDGQFHLKIPKNSASGMYRLLYDNTRNQYVDFIYNNEDISFEFHPDYPSELITYYKSKENKIYQDYLGQATTLQNKLDSLQVIYFKSDQSEDKRLNNLYKKSRKTLQALQNRYELISLDKLANHFIVANKPFYAENLIKTTDQYLSTIKAHFFDAVNFEDPVLLRSSLFVDKINNFVFYLNTANDPKTLNKIYKENIGIVLAKIQQPTLKKDIIESLLYTFGQQENVEIATYLFENHFSKLPIPLQDYEFKSMVEDMLKTTIGNKAPNIVWKEKNKTKSLYKLKGHKYYLVIFWSTTCPHCLKEMPLLQKYLEDKPDVQVIAIALETDTSKVTWVDEKYYYEKFIHILGKNKYENDYVRDYGVSSTPSFFLLDANKVIISKPYDVKEFKDIYPKLKN